jgi:hypothetical protein
MSLTKVSYSMITGAPVNVLDYGAVGNGTVDDSAAFIAAATAAGTNGAVLVPARTYNINNEVNILAGQTWLFDGAILQHTDDTKIILRANAIADWSILGSVILKGTLTSASTAAETGLYITDGKRYRVEGVQAKLFKGKGVWLDGSNAGSLRGDRGQFTDFAAYENTVGVQIDAGAGAEYNTWTNTNISGCITGMIMAAGNNTVVGGSIVDNATGVKLNAGANHCHGMFVGVNISHNNSENLYAENITNGHTFSACHFYGNGGSTGVIWFRNSRGIHVHGGVIDCHIYNDGGGSSGINVVENNYFPDDYGVQLVSNDASLNKLLLLRNFLKTGMSELNAPSPVYVRAARGTSTQAANGGATVVFNNELRDNRLAYNAATGIFTAPDEGVYTVSTSLFVTGAGLGTGYASIVWNSTTVAYAPYVLINSSTNQVANVTIDVVMEIGDTLKITSNATGTVPIIAIDQTWLNIYLKS